MTYEQLFSGRTIERKLTAMQQFKRDVAHTGILSHYNQCDRKAYDFKLDDEAKEFLLRKLQEEIDNLEEQFKDL